MKTTALQPHLLVLVWLMSDHSKLTRFILQRQIASVRFFVLCVVLLSVMHSAGASVLHVTGGLLDL